MVSRLVKCFFAVMLLPVAGVALSIPSNEFDALKARRVVIPSLRCLDDPSQSYAFYLPSQYSPDRRWPIIYAFDPSAHGRTPVELYQKVVEEYGYILVGSNNSENGPAAPAMAAAQAVRLDTHRRFSIDKDRVYTTGLSGGARFATSFALYCHPCAIAGVIAQGAGYPAEISKEAKDQFLYYAAVGDSDCNLPEILELRCRKAEQVLGLKVKIYSGQHEWAPPEVFEDAVEWLELKAIQAGTHKPDEQFVHRLFEQTKREAAEAQEKGHTLDQFYALRSLVVDFKGIEASSTPDFENRLAALTASSALKEARRIEQHEMDRQRFLTEAASGALLRLATAGPDEQIQLKRQVASVLLRLWRRSNSAGSDHALFTRAFNQLWIQGIEEGQEELRQQHFSQAEVYFELMGEAVPDHPWPLLLLAEVRVRAGNYQGAIGALELAVQHGLKNPASVSQDPELQPLSSDPAFQRIVETMGGAK
jgi:dienelactone hydrolase